nr:TorF family putative porin [uncultured Holophaga sp.]
MHLTKSLAIAALAACIPAFAADAPASPHTFTGNFGLTTDYTFRGLTQNNSRPAVQGGFDYSHACGFYAGFWASNASWVIAGDGGSSSMETDFYLGYRFSPVKDLTLDLGAIEYYYPGQYSSDVTKPHTTEAYLSATYKWVNVKYSQAISSDWFQFADAKNTKYVEGNVTLPLPQGLSLVLHGGRQELNSTYSELSYNDYKAALTKEVIPTYTVGLTYTYANTDKALWMEANGDNLGGSRVALSLVKAF